MAPSFLHTILKALATSMGARAVGMALRFITICLLPFWLTPAEVGWAAVLMAIVNILVAVSDMGFATALVRQESCSDQMYRSVYLLITGATVCVACVLIMVAPFLETIAHVPAILITVSAFAIPLSSMALVPNAILNRDLRFTSIALRDLVGEVTFTVVTISLAATGHTAFCIPFALVAHRLVRWFVSTNSVSWKPGFSFSVQDIRQLLSFSMYQFGNIVTMQLANRLDTFLLSYFVPSASLGVYSQGQQLSTQPVEALGGTARSVFFASFSKVQKDPQQLHTLFVKLFCLVLAVSIALIGILFPLMGLIPVVYNEKWAPAISIGRILCLSIPFYAATAFEGVLITIGGEKQRLFSTTVRALIMAAGIIAIFLLRPDADMNEIAALVFVSSGIGVTLNMKYIFKKLDVTFHDIKSCIPLTAASLLIMIAGMIITFVCGF